MITEILKYYKCWEAQYRLVEHKDKYQMYFTFEVSPSKGEPFITFYTGEFIPTNEKFETWIHQLTRPAKEVKLENAK